MWRTFGEQALSRSGARLRATGLGMSHELDCLVGMMTPGMSYRERHELGADSWFDYDMIATFDEFFGIGSSVSLLADICCYYPQSAAISM